VWNQAPQEKSELFSPGGQQTEACSQNVSKISHKQGNIPFTVCHRNCASGISKKTEDINLAVIVLKPSVIFLS
jgi:hypothetical protein